MPRTAVQKQSGFNRLVSNAIDRDHDWIARYATDRAYLINSGTIVARDDELRFDVGTGTSTASSL